MESSRSFRDYIVVDHAVDRSLLLKLVGESVSWVFFTRVFFTSSLR